MKKVYQRPVLQSAPVAFGVFGEYGCDNGGGNNDGTQHDGHHRHGGRRGWWWW